MKSIRLFGALLCAMVVLLPAAQGEQLSVQLNATPAGSSGQVQYNNAGVFGGISGVTTDGTGLILGLSGPLIGNGASAVTAGTKSGNTTVFGTTSGALTSGNCVKIDASGNLVDAGAACGTGAGGYNVYNIKSAPYSAAGNYKAVSDGAMASGSTTLTSATASFAAGDVGKYIAVQGAATAGANLFTTIAGFTNSTTVTLTSGNASGGAISGKFVEWGTDDTSAIQSAINAARTAGGGVVYVPLGNYLVSRLDMTGSGSPTVILVGDGVNASRLWPKNDATYGTATGHVIDLTGAAFDQIENLQIGGYYSLPRPTTAIFMAQIASGASNRVSLSHVYVSGQFSVATIYDYGVPSMRWASSDFYNYASGAGTWNVGNFNSTNPASLSSSFATVTTGTQSMSDFECDDCEFHKFAGAGANNEVLSLTGVNNLTFLSGVISGGATQYVTFNGANTNVAFRSMSMETESQPVTPTNAYNLASASTLNGFDINQTSYILGGNVLAGTGALQSFKNGQQYQANSAGSLAANTTYYVGTGVNDTAAASNAASLVTENSLVCNMRAFTSASPGTGQSYTITLQDNGANTALTTTFSNSTNTGGDQTHCAQVAAGHYINFKVVTSATASATRFAGSVTLLPYGQ